MPLKELLEAFKAIGEESKSLEGWSLTIIGSSILALVGTSYLKPSNNKVRLIYLLFLPGWIFLGLSIYQGSYITRSVMESLFLKEEFLSDLRVDLNEKFTSQLFNFEMGLSFFALWLLSYLLWWVKGKWEISSSNNKK